MPPSMSAPALRITAEPLCQDAFTSFGTVIENPASRPQPDNTKHNVVSANQGSALKYIDVSDLTNHYDLAPSKTPARAVMNMFVCSPRKLESAVKASSRQNAPEHETTRGSFPVKILERHPFTPQTFVPVGLDPGDTRTSYLVIVAPTLPSAHNREDGTSQWPKGPGKPDLSRAKAFLARGSQAVTYGPGTWHAPMVVLGARDIDFVVVQYANGVSLEDCQEVILEAETGAEGLSVLISNNLSKGTHETKARL